MESQELFSARHISLNARGEWPFSPPRWAPYFPTWTRLRKRFLPIPWRLSGFIVGITHSFVGLPFFAVLLAWLTRWIARRRGMESPSFFLLIWIYGVGIASHILLDGMTSFGTRMFTPFFAAAGCLGSALHHRFFFFTSIILLPQIAAWIYSEPGSSPSRARKMWILFSAGAVIVWMVASAAGYPFHGWIVAFAIAVLAALFFLPARGGWGFRITRRVWCRAGVYLMVAYLLACGWAHHVALLRAEDFAAANHLEVARIGALPVPPSFLDWGDALRTSSGLYQAQFDLRGPAPIQFQFVPDSRPDRFTERALQLPEVQTYWTFARFPSIHSSSDEGYHVVDFGEHRFTNGGRRAPQPFSYRVVFDSSGNVLEEGFWPNGMFLQRLTKMHAFPAPIGTSKSPPEERVP